MKQFIPYFIQEKFESRETNGVFQAYTIFIDLSGFTPLTERLMREGNVGAEELSSSLNSIFEPMVKLVYKRSGFIPYFAGDAFTAIFDTKKVKNPEEIIQTACDIRSLFVKEGIRKTRFGDFEIGIKIGISFGKVNWGIVGDTLNTFYFRGPAIDNCAEAEHLARGQEIILDKYFLENISKSKFELEEIKTDFYKLHADILSNFADVDTPIELKTTPSIFKHFLPESVIHFNETGEFRRVITIFIAFKGVENYESLNQFTSLVLEQFHNFSGYFKEIDFGDKGGVMLGFFGAPVSFENNIERVLELALTIKADVAILAKKHSIKIKMGITAGLAFTGIIGGEERCQYAAVGNWVNIAARLMVKAKWGEILVDEEISKAPQYNFAHHGDIQYKGVEANIPTYELKGQKSLTQSGYEGVMRGRKKELKAIHSFTRDILDSKNNGVAYIFGEAGSGKSRLSYELQKKLKKKRSIHWVTCQADQILQKPFNPFVRALNIFFEQDVVENGKNNRQSFEQKFDKIIEDLRASDHHKSAPIRIELTRTKSVLAARLGIFYENSLWSQLDAKGKYQNTITALSQFFLGLSVLKPTVLILEDGHWFDESSKEFLTVFSREMVGFPLAVLATLRYDDNGAKPNIIPESVLEENYIDIHEVNLTNLRPKSLKKIVEQKLGGETHPDFDKAIYQVTNGNPFYLEQVIYYYQEEEMLVKKNNRWTLKSNDVVISNTINAILMARIDRLSNMVKETVKTAAVIGREFEVPILSAVLQKHDDFNNNTNTLVKEQIHAGERGQIWQAMNEIKYIFRHSLLREVVYDMQLHTRLKQLHLIVAESIEQLYPDTIQERYVDLAFHYEQAAIEDKTTEYLEKAAVYAKRNFQNAQSIRYYNRLLEQKSIKKDKEKTATVLLSKGGVHELIGEWEACEKIYKKGLKLINETENEFLKGRANTKLGYLLMLTGRYDKARQLFEKALAHFAQEDDQIGTVRAFGNLGNLFFRQGDYRAALDYFKKTIQQSENLPYHTTSAQIVSNLGLTYMNLGQYDEGIAVQQKQLKTSKKHQDRRGTATLYVNLGIVHFEKGDYDNALECYEKGLELSEILGNKLLTSIAIGCIGSVYQQKGDYQKAADNFVRDLELCEQLGDKQGIAIALGLLGELRSIEGDWSLAIDYLNHCVNLSRELGYQKGIAKAVNNLGDIFYQKEEYQKAAEYYQEAINVARKIKNKLVLGSSLVERALTAIGLGEINHAEELAHEAGQIARDLGNPELVFESQSLDAQLLFHLGKKEEAILRLEALLKNDNDLEEEANLYFELSKMKPEYNKYKSNALERYQVLFQKTPKYMFAKRIKALRII